MGKRLIIPGADFSANGIKTQNVVDVILKDGGTIPYSFYFLPTAMAYSEDTSLPAIPADAVTKNVTNDSNVSIDGTFLSFLFGKTSGMTSDVVIGDLSVAYNKEVSNMQKAFIDFHADSVDLRGINFSQGARVTRMFSGARLKNLQIPEMTIGDCRYMFYDFNVEAPNFSFSFIKKIAGDDSKYMFAYLRMENADFSDIDVSTVTTMGSMFRYTNLKVIDLSTWNFGSGLEWSDSMFADNNNLQIIHLDKWASTNSTSAKYANMFANTPVLGKVFVTNCSSTVKTWLLARLNEVSAGGSASWSETTVDGKACLVKGS